MMDGDGSSRSIIVKKLTNPVTLFKSFDYNFGNYETIKSNRTERAYEPAGSDNFRINTRRIGIFARVEFGASAGVPSYLWHNSRG